MLKIVGCMILCVGIVKSDKEKLWRAANDISQDSKFLNSNLQSFSATSSMICAFQVARLPWAFLFCFKDGVCQASDLAVSPLPKNNPESSSAACFTLVGNGRKYEKDLYNIIC